jgi:hypothetical protein
MSIWGWLTILFVALKLTNFIAWSWIWVLSPIWLPFLIIPAVMFIWGIIAVAVLEFLDR